MMTLRQRQIPHFFPNCRSKAQWWDWKTGMGLDKANSFLHVKGDDAFLNLAAQQVIQMLKDYGMEAKFILMNSFTTSKYTLDFFRK
jgi:UDP-N-acetylglucosamine pyrophosphorylase